MNWLYTIAALIDANEVGIPTITDTNNALSNILSTVYFFAGIISVIVIIVAGFIFTTASGDAAKVTRAKQAILGGVVGLVVVIMAFTITQFILGRFA